MQDELMKVQLKYQKELERLERENKELRKQLLLRENNDTHTKRKIKVKSFNIHLGYEFICLNELMQWGSILGLGCWLLTFCFSL